MRTFFVAMLILTASLSAVAQAKNYALLVGIEDYDHASLRTPPLKYAVDDVTELAELLRRADYEVLLLTDETGKSDPSLSPTRTNIESHLERVLARAERADTVVIAFAGHGLQFEGTRDAYFCPRDARPFVEKADSLVSMKKIYGELESSFAGVKLMFVDACRNDPDPGRGRGGLDAEAAPPPRGVGALFSCSAGQKAFEHDDLKHGVFFYYVLEGLRGAAVDQQGRITFQGLSLYVQDQVPGKLTQLFAGREQLPNLRADLIGLPPVVLRRPISRETLKPYWITPEMAKDRRNLARTWLKDAEQEISTPLDNDIPSLLQDKKLEALCVLAWNYAQLGDAPKVKALLPQILDSLQQDASLRADLQFLEGVARIVGLLKLRSPELDLSSEQKRLLETPTPHRDVLMRGILMADRFGSTDSLEVRLRKLQIALDADDSNSAFNELLISSEMLISEPARLKIQPLLNRMEIMASKSRQQTPDDALIVINLLILHAFQNNLEQLEKDLDRDRNYQMSSKRFWTIPLVIRGQDDELFRLLRLEHEAWSYSAKWTAANALIDHGRIEPAKKLVAELSPSGSFVGMIPPLSRIGGPWADDFGHTYLDMARIQSCILFGRLNDHDSFDRHIRQSKYFNVFSKLYFIDGLLRDLPWN